jgi:hypothetical protein
VARFDKYEPHVGGFRARLNADWLDADVGKIIAVSLNANGRIVKGNPDGASGLKGVVALGMARKAGHPVDVMQFGEILDVVDDDVAGTLAAGINIYVGNTTLITPGTLTTTAANGVYVGHMVEIDRLVVRFAQSTTAGDSTP